MFDRTPLLLCLFAIALLLFCGCANFGGYFRDRANDFVDCFAAQVGISLGLGVRAQFTDYISGAVGASFNKRKVGFCGREIINEKGNEWIGIPIIQLVCAPSVGGLAAFGFEGGGGGILAGIGITLLFMLCTDIVQNSVWDTERLSFLFLNLDFLWGEWIGYDAESPFFVDRFFVKCGVTLGVIGFDVGFNPVEFVDFLLGWFTIDIADDDNARYRPRLRIGPEPP